MATIETRVRKLEVTLVRRQFQLMGDQELLAELLTVMSDTQKAEWQALGATEQQLLATVKDVLREWRYL